MTEPFEERRQRERRRTEGGPDGAERRRADRRQFPPEEDLDEADRALRCRIDAYKKEKGLDRISIPVLLDLLEEMGYRKV